MDTGIAALQEIVRNCTHGGPTGEESERPYFQAAIRFLTSPSRLDMLHANSSSPEVEAAISQVVSCINQDPLLIPMCTSSKTHRLFGAMAVDAWCNNQDMGSVKTLLLKGMLVERMCRWGPDTLSSPGEIRDALARKISHVLRGREIKTNLKALTQGACNCIDVGEVVSEMDEHGNTRTAAVAARKEREMQQLPELVRPGSEFCRLKSQAAAHLKARRLDEAIKVYNQANDIVAGELEETQVGVKNWGVESIRSLELEMARVESNLSMIYFQREQYDKALSHADAAIGHRNIWSKAHCRRALALEKLGRLEDAETSISKALEYLELGEEVSNHAAVKNEYTRIELRLDEALKHQPVTESVRTSRISKDYAEAGAFTSIWNCTAVDTIATFLKPRELAQLEKTCRGFASRPERRRRCSLSGPLLNLCSDEIDKAVRIFVNERHNDPNGAVNTLIKSVLSNLPEEYFHAETTLPLFLRKMLQYSDVSMRNAIQQACLMKQERLRIPLSYWMLYHLHSRERLVYGCHDDEEVEGTVRLYENDDDGQLLRVISWFPTLEEDEGDLGDQLDTAMLAVNNLLSFCGRTRLEAREDGAGTIAIQFTNSLSEIVSREVPVLWPCEVRAHPPMGETEQWVYTADDIYEHFTTNPPSEFRRWKSAFNEIFKWAEETKHHIYRLIPIFQGCLFDLLSQRGHVPVNVFSVGLFAMKKSIESGGGGASTMRRNIYDLRYTSALIAEFYSMLRIYNAAIPKCLEWRDQTMAQHYYGTR